MRKILYTILTLSILIIIINGIKLIQIKREQMPITFIDLESYKTAKYFKGTIGGICIDYANRFKKLYPDTKVEIVKLEKNSHARVLIYEDKVVKIYTDRHWGFNPNN